MQWVVRINCLKFRYAILLILLKVSPCITLIFINMREIKNPTEEIFPGVSVIFHQILLAILELHQKNLTAYV